MDLRSGAVKIGRLFGVNVRVHVLFLLWIGFDLMWAGMEWPFHLQIYAVIFAVVLCHEFGHCLGARAVGGQAEDIVLWPLGGLAYARAPLRPWPQFVTVACGPLVNLAFCLLSGGVLIVGTVLEALLLGPSASPANSHVLRTGWLFYVLVFFVINLLLLAFNLLPIFPLDGGQLLRVLFWRCLGLPRATILSGKIGIVGVAVMGIAGAMSGDANLIFIGLFGGITSYRHYRAASQGLITDELQSVPRAGRIPRDSSQQSAAVPNLPSPTRTEGGSGTVPTELDRILKKASERGYESLTYVERQTLERVTRERQRED